MNDVIIVANRDVCPICQLYIGFPLEEDIGTVGEVLSEETMRLFNKILRHREHIHLMEDAWARIEAGAV